MLPLHSRFVALFLAFTTCTSFSVETSEITFEGKRMTVSEVDLRKDQLQLFLRDEKGEPFKRFARLNGWLGQRDLQLRWAMNAGMYHREYGAVGLFVADAKELSPLNLANGEGNFFLKPNGVFYITKEGAGVVSAESYAALKPAANLATQSGPALVLDGRLHQAFRAGSQNRLHRNGVGVRDAQKVYFALSEDPVNFDEFARFFRDRLGCRNALFFDGTVSSLHDAQLKRSDEKIDLGPIIAITETKKP